MGQVQTLWRDTAYGIRRAIWIYTLAGIAGSVVSFVGGLLSPVDIMETIEAMMSGDADEMFGEPSVTDVLGWLCTVGVVGGYIAFYLSAGGFVAIQSNEADRVSAGKIKSAFMLMIWAAVIGFLPVIGSLIAFIMMLVAYTRQRSGYRGLGESRALSAKAREGAMLLRTCTGWIVASIFIAWIPVFGGFFESIILIVTFFQILKGWKLVGENDTTVTAAAAATVSPAVADEAQEYADILAVKSDEELKEIAGMESAFTPAFVSIARHELMERTLGHRSRRTQEEIDAEKAERERARREEEERARREAEEEEARRREEKERRLREQEEHDRKVRQNLKKAAPFIAAAIAAAVAAGIVVWNNTPRRLVERGVKAYEKGDAEKGMELIGKGEEKGDTLDAWIAYYHIYDRSGDKERADEYLTKLVEMRLPLYCMLYGMRQAENGADPEEYVEYLRYGYDRYPYYHYEDDSNRHIKERGRSAYMIGCYDYSRGETSDAKWYWVQAANMECKEANARLGDYILCHERKVRGEYRTALEYYKNAPQDMPGVKEKVEIMTEIVASNPEEWMYCDNGFYALSGSQDGEVWGYKYFKYRGGHHIYGKFRPKGNCATGAPFCNGIWCDRIKDSYGLVLHTYNVWVGGMTCRNGVWDHADGKRVASYPDGRVCVWESGTDNCYDVSHSWTDAAAGQE